MAAKHGDLEKYLGAKYAQQLAENPGARAAYEDAREVLYGSMDVMSMFNKVQLAMRQMNTGRATR